MTKKTTAEQLIEDSEESFKYAAKAHTKTVLLVQEHRSLINAIASYRGIYISAGSQELSISVSGTQDELLSLLAIVKEHDYHPHSDNKVSDSPAETWTGRFSRKGENHTCLVIGFYSTVCKKVQVGTKMVEQPIYEIRCGSQSAEPTGIDLANGPTGTDHEPMPTETGQPSSLEPFITEHEDIPF